MLWPSHVIRSPEVGGFCHAASGLSTGSSTLGRRALPPKNSSPRMGSAGPFSPGVTGQVLWNVPSRHCRDARARSSRSRVRAATVGRMLL